MTSEQYRDALLAHWRVIVACVVLATLGALLGSQIMAMRQPPIYRSTATIEVDISGAFADLTGFMATEARLATSQDVLNEAAQHVAGLSATQMASAISTSLDGTTHLIQITASDRDAQRASDTANAVANALIARQQKITQASNTPTQQQVQQQIDDTQRKIDALTTQLQSLQRDPQNQQSQIADVQSQLSALREQHALLQWTLAQLQVAQVQGVPTMLVAQQATPSTHAISQSLTARAGYGAAGFFFGLALGIVIALGHDQFVRRRQPLTKVAISGEAND